MIIGLSHPLVPRVCLLILSEYFTNIIICYNLQILFTVCHIINELTTSSQITMKIIENYYFPLNNISVPYILVKVQF